MANKSKFLKNLLTTASALAVLASGVESAIGAATRTNSASPAAFSTGANWAGTAPVDGDNIALGQANNALNYDVAGPMFITQIDLATKALTSLTLAVGNRSITVGNMIVNGGTAGPITFDAGGGGTVILAGGTAANRNAAPVYSGLTNINFVANNPNTLVINNLAKSTVVAAPTVGAALTDLTAGPSEALNAGSASILNVMTSLKTAHSSWGTIGTVNIGTAAVNPAPAVDATYEITDTDATNEIKGTVNFLTPGSQLTLNAVVGGANNFELKDNQKIGGNADLNGVVQIGGTVGAVALNSAAAGVNNGTIGIDATHRVAKLVITGNQVTTLNLPIFAQLIDPSGMAANGVVFSRSVVGGVGSILNFGANTASVALNGINGVGNAAVTNQIETINFANNDKALNIGDGANLTANIQGNGIATNVSIGTVTFGGTTNFKGLMIGVKKVAAGAANRTVTFAPPNIGTASNNTITEINSPANNGNLVFLDGFNIGSTGGVNSGSINQTAGVGGPIWFAGGDAVGTTVAGNIGASSAATSLNVGANGTAAPPLVGISDSSNGKLIVNGTTATGIINVGGDGAAGGGGGAGGNGTATFTGAVATTGTINVGGDGTAQGVGGNGTATFTGAITGAGTTVNVGGATVTNAGGDGNVTYGGNLTRATNINTLNSVVNIGPNVTHTGVIDNTSAVATGAGTLNIDTTTAASSVTGAIGGTNPLLAINTNTVAGNNATLGGLTKTATLNINGADGTTVLANQANQINFVKYGSTGTLNTGATSLFGIGGVPNLTAVNFNGHDGNLIIACTLTGTIDNNGAAQVPNVGTVTLAANGGVTGDIGDTSSVKKVDVAGNTGAFGGAVNTQTFSIAGGTANVAGAMTTGTGNTQGVVFSGNGTLNLTNTAGTFTGKIDFAGNTSHVTMASATAVLDATIASGAANSDITFTGAAATLTGGTVGNFGLGNIKFGAIGNATILGFGGTNQSYKSTAFTFVNAGSVLNLNQDGTTLIGNIVGIANPTEGINVSDNANITGQIGTGNPVGYLNFITNSGKTLTITNTTGAATITLGNGGGASGAVNFAVDGTLVIKGVGAQSIVGGITSIGVPTSSVGTITLDSSIGAGSDVTLPAVGTAVNPLGTLAIGAAVASGPGQFVDLSTAAANINNITLGGATNIKLGTFTYQILNLAPTGSALITGANLLIGANNVALSIPAGGTASYGSSNSRIGNIIYNGDYSLTIGDGISIYGGKVTSNPLVANGQGSLVFQGSGVFDLAFDTGSPVKSITASGAIGKEMQIIQDVVTKGGAGIAIGDGTLSFAGNMTDASGAPAAATGIYATTADAGKLKLINADNVVVTHIVGNGGGAGLLKNVEFNGAGNVTFNNAFAISAANLNGSGLLFTNASESTATTLAFKLPTVMIGAMNVDATGAALVPTIVAYGNDNNAVNALAFAANVSVAGKVLYQLNDTGASTVTVNSANMSGASFVGVNSTNNFIVGADDVVINNLGMAEKTFANATFNANGTISGETHADAINVALGKTATFGNLVDSDSLNLVGAASGAKFNQDGFVLNTPISTAATGGQGTVAFAGAATINSAIGALGKMLNSVTFGGDNSKDVMLNANIYANNTNFGASNIVLTDTGATLGGITTFTNADLSNQTLTMSNAIPTGDLTIDTSIAPVNGVLSGGNIVFSPKAKNDLSKLSSIKIVINDSALNAKNQLNGTFVIIDNSKGDAVVAAANIDSSKINVSGDGGNAFTKWTVSSFDSLGTLTLALNDNSANVVAASLAAATGTSAADVANATTALESPGLYAELSGMTPANQAATIQRIVATDAGNVVSATLENQASSISSHLGSLAGLNAPSGQTQRVVDSGPVGVAAGDSDAGRYGIWFSPFFNKGVQKARQSAAGYSAQTAGGSIGFDTKTNEDMIVGAAVSYLNTDIKYKNYKSGDKGSVNSTMLSIYGMQQITDNWFGQAIGTVASNAVKTTEKRITGNTTSQTASGKYTSMSFAAEASIGYNYSTDIFSVTPMGGIRASRVNDGGYTETGTTNQNLTVTKKASNKFELFAGIRAAGGTFNLNGLVITPEIHGFINQDLIGRNPQVTMTLAGGNSSLNPKRAKPVKTTYNMGAGLNATYDMMEYGIGYDANIATKYLSQQGSVKVRVNF